MHAHCLLRHVHRRLLLLVLACGCMGSAAAPPPLEGQPAADAPAVAAGAGPHDRWRQRADLVVRHYPLPPGTTKVRAMVQDAQGFLWLGMATGLFRWDGYRFERQAEPGVPGGLPDVHVKKLHLDPRGRLWVGTNAGGLARLDAATGRYEAVSSGPAGLSSANVGSIADDGRGGLWVGTVAGLDHLLPDGRTVQRHAEAAHLQGLPDGTVSALLLDASGTLWVGTRTGLFRRAADGQRFEAVPTHPGQAPNVICLAQDRHGRVWVGSRTQGAFVIEPGAAWASAVRDTEAAEAAGLQGDVISSFTEGGADEMWIGTYGAGVVRVDTRSWKTHRVRHREQARPTLADDKVNFLYRDRSGLVWIATDTSLQAHDPRPRGLDTWLGEEGSADRIPDRHVISLLPMSVDTTWLGTGDGGLAIVSAERGLVARVRPDPARPANALPKGEVMAMARGPSGEAFLGTLKGLYRADAAGRSFRRVDIPGRDPQAATRALWVEADHLWLGGDDTEGLWHLRLTAAGVQVVAKVRLDRLAHERVALLAPAPQGRLWVGTYSGLLLYDPQGETVSRWPADEALAREVPAGIVSGVVTDAQGRVWIAPYGKGIRVVQPGASPAVRRITTREGLPHDGVASMLLDRQGQVWVSTDNGLARIDSRSLEVTALDGADGLGITNFWDGSALAPGGELLFGGQGGLAIVDPQRLDAWAFQPPVVVTALDVGAGSITHQPSPQSGPAVLALDAARRSLHVEFAALDYSAPESIRYAYRLRGFDKDWIQTDATRRFATYTNLPPGDYVLELRGTNRRGVWSPTLAWPVRAVPRWYETGAFRLAAALAALLAVAGMVQARTMVLRRRQRRLQQLVDERTAELEALNASRTRLLAAACHDLRQPAHALGMLAELADGEPDAEARTARLAGIRRSSSTLTDMLTMLLDLTELEGGRYEPRKLPIALADLMYEVELQYAGAAQRKGLQLLLPVSPLHVHSDRHLLRRIVFNLVSNAIKYTERGTVRIVLRPEGARLNLSVEDSGPGIPADRLQEVFADYVRLDASHEAEGLGIGLSIVRRAADLLGHPLAMASTVGQGTVVTLTLPLVADGTGRVAEPAAETPATGQGRLILLVEDDRESLEAMADLLRRRGFRVMAATGFQALASLLERWDGDVPSLLVTDLHLRDGNGLEEVQRIRRHPGLSRLPALLITGDLAACFVEQARAERIFLAYKPLPPARLFAMVDEALRAEAVGQGAGALP